MRIVLLVNLKKVIVQPFYLTFAVWLLDKPNIKKLFHM